MINSNTLILIICGICIVFLLCLKLYAQYKQEYRNNVSIIPIVAQPILHNNTNFQEEKVSDDNLYSINI
jgi:hypothetical protein